MKNIKKYIIGIAASICLTQCDVLDVDPTGWYSENVAYSSLENVDLYVKGLYSVLYDNATINIDSYCLMDDGATDLLLSSFSSGDTRNPTAIFIQRFLFFLFLGPIFKISFP